MSPSKDAIDVEFETINTRSETGDTQAVSKSQKPDVRSESDDEQLAVFGKQTARNTSQSMSLPVFALVAAVCTSAAFYLAGGHALIGSNQQQIDRPASLPADQQGLTTVPLVFEDITSNIVERSNLKVLTIRATILNKSETSLTIPSVIVRLGNETTTNRMFRINRGETLNPGERLVFTNSLPVGNAPDTKPILSFSE